MRRATADDRMDVKNAQAQSHMQTNWTTCDGLKSWAKKQGWPTPWFNFEDAFYQNMLENDANFALTLAESGLKITIPKAEYTISDEKLRELDQEYADHEWGYVVEGLREIRRAIEAGVVVHVDGETLKSFDRFYTWAHDRYHALEDGYDSWIGDDVS
jgi:hypothetical protein